MRLGRHVLSIALVSLAGATAAQAQAKIAFINSKDILDRAPGRAAAATALEKEFGPLRPQVQRMEDSLNLMIAQFDSTESKLTPEQRTERRTAIRTRQQEFQTRMQGMQQQAAQREEELMGPILDMAKRALDDERAAGGYSIIFDLSAAQNSPIVAFDKNLDITERVITRLATMRPAPATRPNAAAPATPRPAGGAPAQTPAGVTRPKPPTR